MSFNIKPISNLDPEIKHKPIMNPFSDKVMGDWEYDKKGSTGNTIYWTRRATITLAEVYAQDYIDPKTMKAMKIYGEVTLVEKKAIDKKTSSLSMFRSVEPTEKSVIKEVII